jgi:hypothetical protein
VERALSGQVDRVLETERENGEPVEATGRPLGT